MLRNLKKIISLMSQMRHKNISKSDVILNTTKIPGPKGLSALGFRFIRFIGKFYNINNMKVMTNLSDHYGSIVQLNSTCGHDPHIYLLSRELCSDLYKESKSNNKSSNMSEIQHLKRIAFARKHIIKTNEITNELITKIPALRNEVKEMPRTFMDQLLKWSIESTFVMTFGKKLRCLDPEFVNSDATQIINCVKEFNVKHHLKSHPLLWNAYDTQDLDIINAILLIQKHVSLNKKNQDGIIHEMNIDLANVTACELLLNTKMTSNAAAALLYHIANNKQKQEKLREEAMLVLPEKTTFITNNTLKDVKYVKACIKESMRLSPIVNGNLRTIEQNSSIGKYKILKGSTVMACHGWLSLHPEYFPEPEKYKPERWLKNEPEYKQSQSYVYQPFGIGKRSCIGQKIVEMQLTMLILKVVRNFRIEWHYGPLKWKTENTVNTVTSPLRLKIMRIYGK